MTEDIVNNLQCPVVVELRSRIRSKQSRENSQVKAYILTMAEKFRHYNRLSLERALIEVVCGRKIYFKGWNLLPKID